TFSSAFLPISGASANSSRNCWIFFSTAWSCSDDLGAADVTIWISIPLFAPHALPVPVKPGKSRQGSTVVAGTSPWPQAPAADPISSRAGTSPCTRHSNSRCGETILREAKRTESHRPNGNFVRTVRLLPTQLLLSEGDKPVQLGSRALEILIVLL